jgi:hypothetical protein
VPAAAELKKMKTTSNKSILWQHSTKPLVYAAWLENNIVNKLSNFHLPEILDSEFGVKQKKRDDNGRRDRSQSNVACPVQMKEYGTSAEASYDMGGKNWTNNWTPKLVFWFYNMALNNAYKLCQGLVMAEDGNCILNMGNAVKELAHGLCQKGKNIPMHAANHPVHWRNMGVFMDSWQEQEFAQMQNGHGK